MTFRAPVQDILFTMKYVAGLNQGVSSGLYPDLADNMAEAVLEEAGKFADTRIAPLNRIGDKEGARLIDGRVVMPQGFTETYQEWISGGWMGLAADPAYGGQGLPILLNIGCTEIWNAANLAFSLHPLLTMGAIEALSTHGSEALRKIYLPKLVAGEWSGTMNLTEPQAGSDLALLNSRAERQGDGTYRLFGQKIFITYGDHEITSNILHLVLARLPDAPPGTRGISLFLVPKFLVNPDGSLGARNDVRCHSLEHKLGIHSSPTATMIFGDEGGAIGYLIGEENKGLACMFTMMNNARLGVGVQGVAVAERAYQHALLYAKERKQGKASHAKSTSPIIDHPDVKRMLLDMRSKIAAARAFCLVTAAALDRAHRAPNPTAKREAFEEASLLTPIAKAFSTDIGVEVASTGVQIHGGMGFIEESGAAQHYRDARILSIYEGTNGIQAIDLVMRKITLSDGEAVKKIIAHYRHAAEKVATLNAPGFKRVGELVGAAIDSLERATAFMLEAIKTNPDAALAGATPYLRLFAMAGGGAYLAEAARAARVALSVGEDDALAQAKLQDVRYFAENLASLAGGLEISICEAGEAINQFKA